MKNEITKAALISLCRLMIIIFSLIAIIALLSCSADEKGKFYKSTTYQMKVDLDTIDFYYQEAENLPEENWKYISETTRFSEIELQENEYVIWQKEDRIFIYNKIKNREIEK